MWGGGGPGARTSTQPAEPSTTHLRMESSSETTLLRPEIPSMRSRQTRTEARGVQPRPCTADNDFNLGLHSSLCLTHPKALAAPLLRPFPREAERGRSYHLNRQVNSADASVHHLTFDVGRRLPPGRQRQSRTAALTQNEGAVLSPGVLISARAMKYTSTARQEEKLWRELKENSDDEEERV